ncbi:MAG: MoxR family ATPase [Planctomycetota bacterium]
MGEIASALSGIIRGKTDVIGQVLTALLADGSILLEDVPGVGKTTLAKSLASMVGLEFGRVQCTPDLLPADILGGPIYRPQTGEFEFRPGPVFCNLLIADEINRASPRTQSALLEAMAESQVTIDGTRYALKRPFIVIATQNPGGFEGTFPLPESQMDRFLIRMNMDYPDPENEIAMLLDEQADEREADPDHAHDPKAIIHGADLLQYQAAVRQVAVDAKVAAYLVAIVHATRQDSRIRIGCSPRGSKMLLRMARASAIMKGRGYLLPDDVQAVAVPTLAHRMSLQSAGSSIGDATEILQEILTRTEIPV